MSCGCNQSPCACELQPVEVCDPPVPVTKCDRYDGTDNCWVEKGDPSAAGVCMLDTMDDSQIINVLEHDQRARADLLKVTSDPDLLKLARTIPKLPVQERADIEQALVNKPNEPASIPFYALFRGQPPFVG